MAVREIKTTLAVDGERAFNKAVTEAGRNMRVMASEMKAAAADFNLTGDEMEYLGRKSKSLEGQIEQQENIIRALEGAISDAADAYGDASAKTDGYRIKLNNAQAMQAKLKKELEDTNREMTELGRDAGRVGRQLEEGIGDAAQDARRDIERLANALDEDLSNIGKSVDFSAFKDKFDMTVDVIGGVGDALTSLTEGTEDYRRTMSFLEQNALTAGMDTQVIRDMTFEVSALTGELDGAVEGMSNLMAAGFEEDELAQAVERLSAAVIQFPDTLKFESLADSLQESVATGQAVGQYAEYLERMGLDLETVNKSFEEAAKKGGEAVETVALAWLNNPDAENALDLYKEMNEDLINAQIAQQKWNDEVARTADLLQPYVTAITEYKTQLLSLFNEAISGEKTINGKQAKIWWLPDLNKDEQAAEPEESGIFKGLERGFEEAARKAATWFDSLFKDEDVAKVEQNADTIGGNIGTAIGDGIASQTPYATYQAALMMRQIEAELSRPIQGPTIQTNRSNQASPADAGGTQTANVSLTLDGRTLGRTTAEYNSDAMGAAIDRYETYG